MLAVLCMPRLRLLDRVALTAETFEELHRYGQSYFGMQLKNHVSSDGQLLVPRRVKMCSLGHRGIGEFNQVGPRWGALGA